MPSASASNSVRSRRRGCRARRSSAARSRLGVVSRSRRASVTSVITSPSVPVAGEIENRVLHGQPRRRADRLRRTHLRRLAQEVPRAGPLEVRVGAARRCRPASAGRTEGRKRDRTPRVRGEHPGRRRGCRPTRARPTAARQARCRRLPRLTRVQAAELDESRDDVAAHSQADGLFPGDDAPLVQGEADEGIGDAAGVNARRESPHGSPNRPPDTESVDGAQLDPRRLWTTR